MDLILIHMIILDCTNGGVSICMEKYGNKEHLVTRYTQLARRLSEFPLMNQGNWKPEYDREINEIRAELAKLRTSLKMDGGEQNEP